MPEALGHTEAVEELRRIIASRWEESVELLPADLARRFPNRPNLAAAWRVPSAITEPPQGLLVAVDTDFPWSLPKFALLDPVNGIAYPHVEHDGHLCLASATARFKLPVCIDHITQLIEDANNLLSDGHAEANESDFYAEAQSYWSLVAPSSTELWISAPPPEEHAVWSSLTLEKNFLIAPDKQSALAWAKASSRRPGIVQPALVLRLPAPLHPRDYPLTMGDIFKLADSIGASFVVQVAISRWRASQPLPVLFNFIHDGATVLLGGCLLPPGQIRMPGARQNGIPGFRNGRKGGKQARLRALSTVPTWFPRLKVAPVYREYLHTRTTGITASDLRGRHVIIAGCGALGGQLAVQLAQAGVGHLTLLDDELLDWRNVGRHVLDGSDVGRNKAIALADNIRRRFPDARVDRHAETWEARRRANGKEFETADLMVSVTGEAAGNRQLDALVENGEVPPTIFGWVEPFGVAAHAILRYPNGGKLADISNLYGLLVEPVADLDTAPALPQEPSCGAFYQPYSALSALPSIALIGNLVVDALLDRISRSCHRVWVGSAEAFPGNGLSIHPSWHGRLNALGYDRRFEIPMPRKEG